MCAISEMWTKSCGITGIPMELRVRVCVCLCVCVCVCVCVHKSQIQREMWCFWNDVGKIPKHSEEAWSSGVGLKSYKGGGNVTYSTLKTYWSVFVASLSCIGNAYISFGRRGNGRHFQCLLRTQKGKLGHSGQAGSRDLRTQVWGVLISFLSLLCALEHVTWPLWAPLPQNM